MTKLVGVMRLLGLLFVFPSISRGFDDSGSPRSRALIVVGLPGDAEHEALFKATAKRWKDWLTGPLGFPSDEVRILSKEAAEVGYSDGAATRESLALEADLLREKSRAGDRAWVFVLGHTNEEAGHTWLHLPGPDLRDDAFAALFQDLAAGEQVFWITPGGAGAFLPGLSKAGRIVVAATERTGELNETEFPHVLAEVAQVPFQKLDDDKDGQVSIRELFLTTSRGVAARFATDRRAPTEHAQLDDNGDRVGTEPDDLIKPASLDGALASKTRLPRAEAKTPPNSPSRSEHGTNRVVPPSR